MKICYIIGAGELPLLYINPKDAYVIAADGGLKHLEGIAVDTVIGDFDSLGFVPDGSNTVVLPVKKDITDMKAAALLGEKKGCEVFVIYGGTGGRPDHTFANYALLCELAEKGLKGFLIGDGFVVSAVKNSSIELSRRCEGVVSVFSASDVSKGVSIEGLEYSLENADLHFSEPLGVSNSFIGRNSQISVKDGMLLVMWEENNLQEFIDNL